MGLFSTLVLLSLAAGSVYGDGLNTRAKAAGKLYFGTATDNPELTDSAYVALVNNTEDFGQLTPGNSMKWDTVEPTRNTFSFTKGDVIASMAETNGQLLRCHTLVWYNQLPSWVSNGGFDNATLIEIMKNHITEEVTHYKGKCYAWDVVNEALNEDGTFRDSVFYTTIGEAYIPIAFAAAAAADPDAKLYYNDYNIETSGNKATAAVNIVKNVQAYGAKIDGVGLQAHLIVGSVPSASTLASTLTSFTDLGVEVAYTELDIRTTTPASDATLQQQATDYSNVVGACKQVEACVGVTIWDLTDKYSWVPSTFSGQGEALPWDENLEEKPAYDAILSAWGNAATGSNTSVAPTATALPTTLITSTLAATASSAAAPTGTSTGTAAHYAQCGGIGYSGPTTCTSPYTCTYSSNWYSQCL